jgi:hypothetical protein
MMKILKGKLNDEIFKKKVFVRNEMCDYMESYVICNQFA